MGGGGLLAVERKFICGLRVELFFVDGAGAASGKAVDLLLLFLLAQVGSVSRRGRILGWSLLNKLVQVLGLFEGILTFS